MCQSSRPSGDSGTLASLGAVKWLCGLPTNLPLFPKLDCVSIPWSQMIPRKALYATLTRMHLQPHKTGYTQKEQREENSHCSGLPCVALPNTKPCALSRNLLLNKSSSEGHTRPEQLRRALASHLPHRTPWTSFGQEASS